MKSMVTGLFILFASSHMKNTLPLRIPIKCIVFPSYALSMAAAISLILFSTSLQLSAIVDAGGQIRDVFVYHKVYGILKADMGIKSRRDIRAYMEEISTGKSSLLKNVTSGYHYHTIDAESEEILDTIQEELRQRGFLAKLQDYEPVDFWGGQG